MPSNQILKHFIKAMDIRAVLVIYHQSHNPMNKPNESPVYNNYQVKENKMKMKQTNHMAKNNFFYIMVKNICYNLFLHFPLTREIRTIILLNVFHMHRI